MQIHDLIGIGFGPSNIALAIALDGQLLGKVHMWCDLLQPGHLQG